MVKSACGIEAVYMCFNRTGIWGGETLYIVNRSIFLFPVVKNLPAYSEINI